MTAHQYVVGYIVISAKSGKKIILVDNKLYIIVRLVLQPQTLVMHNMLNGNAAFLSLLGSRSQNGIKVGVTRGLPPVREYHL